MTDTAADTAPLVESTSRWLHASPHDTFVWERLRLTSAAIDELATEASQRLPSVEPLMADLFSAFYRAEVRRADAEDPTVEVNKPILDRVLRSPAYIRMHPQVNGNSDDAALLIDAFVRSLTNSLEPELVEFLDAERQFHEDKARLEAEAEAIRALSGRRARKSAEADDDESDELSPEKMSASQRKERLAELVAEIENVEHEHRTDYRQMRARRQMRNFIDDVEIGEQLEAAEEAAEDFAHAMAAWGADPGAPVQLSLDERLRLFHRFVGDDKLRRATELLGRARTRAAGKHRSRTAPAPRQIESVEMGNNLTAILPSELIYLAEPAAQPEFYRRYATEELLQRRYQMEGNPERGPLVVLVDESASMDGERELVAKSLALALVGIAAVDGRAAALIEFASVGEQRVTHFAPGQARLPEVVEALAHHFGGGTDFDAPLGMALDIIEDDSRYETADIVIITDAEAPLHPDTVKRITDARDAGARLHALCVGVGDGPFRDIAYRTWPLADLAAERDDPQILGSLIDAIH